MRDSGIISLTDPVTGELNWVDEKTEAILTSAMLGFANFGTTGVLLAALGKKY